MDDAITSHQLTAPVQYPANATTGLSYHAIFQPTAISFSRVQLPCCHNTDLADLTTVHLQTLGAYLENTLLTLRKGKSDTQSNTGQYICVIAW